jgi:hypothetical protein
MEIKLQCFSRIDQLKHSLAINGAAESQLIKEEIRILQAFYE